MSQQPSTSEEGPREPPFSENKDAPTGLIVNKRRQEGNPVLKYVRNVRYEWGDIGPDFECGPHCAIVYLTFKYHRMHPDYVYSRISSWKEKTYKVKVLLALSNVEEPRHVLRELNLTCFREGWSLIVCYSVEEAAEYIENMKLCEYRDVNFKKPATTEEDSSLTDERKRLHDAAAGILSSARSVTKSDAQKLLFHFGTMAKICQATEEQLNMCPGLGPIKAKNLYNFLRMPFSS